jgi:hypothetical protein
VLLNTVSKTKKRGGGKNLCCTRVLVAKLFIDIHTNNASSALAAILYLFRGECIEYVK